LALVVTTLRDMPRVGRALMLLAATALAGCVSAGTDHHTDHAAAKPRPDPQQRWRETLARPAHGAGAAFDAGGRLWRAEVRGQHLEVSVSSDRGRTFSVPVRVNPRPEHIAADGENRPKIVVDRGGRIYVSYTQALDRPMTGHIRFSRSLDGGRSFAAPITVNDNLDVISHRFEAMAVSDKGEVHLAWLDKRDLRAAEAGKPPDRGAALYYAVSRDGGATFAANTRLADHTCECCRVAMTLDADGTPVVIWRHIFETNLRDHAWLRLDGHSAMQRLSHEQWAVDACPHHGPALAIDAGGIHHAAWYSGATSRSGLFYARSDDGGKTFSPPLAFGDNDAQAGHPSVISLGSRACLAWKEFDGQNTNIRAMRSSDGGLSWGAPRTLAATAERSDHPQLISDGKTVFLAWNTAREGFRLIEIAGP
jgi:hypothetical protein